MSQHNTEFVVVHLLSTRMIYSSWMLYYRTISQIGTVLCSFHFILRLYAAHASVHCYIIMLSSVAHFKCGLLQFSIVLIRSISSYSKVCVNTTAYIDTVEF